MLQLLKYYSDTNVSNPLLKYDQDTTDVQLEYCTAAIDEERCYQSTTKTTEVLLTFYPLRFISF